VSGVVLTMFDAQAKLSGEVINELKGFIEQARGTNVPWAGARVFETRIRRNIKLAESPSFGQTIFAYEPTSNGAADYRALAREVMEMNVIEPKPAVATHSVEVSINREIDVAQLRAANPAAEAASPGCARASSPEVAA
jgi:chromosome partitioning protein